MKQFLRKNSLYIIFCIILIIIYDLYFYNVGYTSMSEIKHNPYTQNMTTRCAGRFLIDIPADFTPLSNQRVERGRFNDFQFETYNNISLKEFQEKLRKYKNKLRITKTVDKQDEPYLKETYPLSYNQNGIIFNRNFNIGNSDYLREIEGYLWSNNTEIIMSVDAFDIRNTKHPEDKKYFKGDIEDDTTEKINQMQLLFNRIEGWDNINIPSGQGSCYENVFIKGAAGDKENASNQYYYKGDRGLKILVEYNTIFKEQDTMLQRFSPLNFLDGTILIRKEVRHINNMNAEELLLYTSNGPDNDKHYYFVLKINEQIASPKTPSIMISLENSGKYLSEKDALTIWDAIIPTLKPRTEAY